MSVSGLLTAWAPLQEGKITQIENSPGELTALSVFPSVKWVCQAVYKCNGRSRPALSPEVEQENPSFDPSPCISSTWPVI